MMVKMWIALIFVILHVVNGNLQCTALDENLKKDWSDGTTNIQFTENGFTTNPFFVYGTQIKDFQCVKDEGGFRVYKSENSYLNNEFQSSNVYTCIKILDKDFSDEYLQIATFGKEKNAIRWTGYSSEPKICDICRLQSLDDKPVLSLVSTEATSGTEPQSKIILECNIPEVCQSEATSSFDKICKTNDIASPIIQLQSVGSLVKENENKEENENDELKAFCTRLIDILNGRDDDDNDDDDDVRSLIALLRRYTDIEKAVLEMKLARGKHKGKGKKKGHVKQDSTERKDSGENGNSGERKRKGKCNKKLEEAIRVACPEEQSDDK